MHQITLRQIPDPLVFLLKEKAKASGMSINKTIISLLKKAFDYEHQPSEKQTKKRDLSSVFVRPWTDEECREFEENIAFFEQIDEEIWK